MAAAKVEPAQRSLAAPLACVGGAPGVSWNPGQADIDGDGVGDACDDTDDRIPGVCAGFEGANVIIGTDAAETLVGTSGSDTIRGQKGADNIRGQKGADIINGGKGTDHCNGGPGSDTKTRCES